GITGLDRGYLQRPVRAAHRGAAPAVVLDAAEDRVHVVPGPARSVAGRDGVVVAAMDAEAVAAVERAGRAERPAPRTSLDRLGGLERTGGLMPGHGRGPEQLSEAAGHGDARIGVLPARLDQQYLGGGIGRQPVRQDTAGRAGTDDDVVETGHRAAPGLLGQGSQRGRRRATLVPEEGAGKGAPKPNLPSAR